MNFNYIIKDELKIVIFVSCIIYMSKGKYILCISFLKVKKKLIKILVNYLLHELVGECTIKK